jgi:hypothetical protein
VTDALCFNCGAIKFGALCPCHDCGGGPSGEVNLDIIFSDHHLARETLRQFGEVVRAIRRRATNPDVAFWAFIAYVSKNHPEILTAKPPQQISAAVDALLAAAQPPRVVVQWKPRDPRLESLPADPVPDLPAESQASVPGSLAVPDEWVAAFRARYPFDGMSPLEILTHDGKVLRGHFWPQLSHYALWVTRGSLTLADVKALRRPRGCVPSFRARPWGHVEGHSPS